jgi:hypothetical protein
MINRIRLAWLFVPGGAIFAMVLFASPVTAQQPPADTSSSGQSTAKKSEDQKDSPGTPPNVPKNDRIFYALPNFLTVENASQMPPLTTGQKFKLVAKGTFDPVEYPYVAVISLIAQGENSEAAFGQGFSGYAKRYGASLTDNTVGNFTTGAVFASLFRQDPRYYQLGKGGVAHRVGYAASRLFVTRCDSGHAEFNVSEILGNGVAAGISNFYHPASDRTVSNNISIWWSQIFYDLLANELKEFWPDLHRKLQKHKSAAP